MHAITYGTLCVSDVGDYYFIIFFFLLKKSQLGCHGLQGRAHSALLSLMDIHCEVKLLLSGMNDVLLFLAINRVLVKKKKKKKKNI